MNKKVIGKINSAIIALLLLSVLAVNAKDMKIILWDKIKKQNVLEIRKDDDVQKLLNYLTGDESYRYAVEFEVTMLWPYDVDEEFLQAFNVPNCCEVIIL